MAVYRPRGTLARVIYAKFHNDNFLENIDTQQWYSLNCSELPERFQSKFVALKQPDTITIKWLERAKMLSSNIWLHLWHALARSVLQFFMTQTDINGLLKRGSMFILSEDQFYKLLEAGGFVARSLPQTITLLDIGAGDGEVSLRVANSVTELSGNAVLQVFATEASWTMRERLKKLNFNVVTEIQELQNVELISCLNVLDRCFDSFKLLEDIHTALAPHGRAVIALVLPYMHYVETNTSHLPLRPLMDNPNKRNGRGTSFEEEATMFLELLENCGFRVESWTKAPYLCEGDLRQSFYWLIDIIVVLSKTTT
ncbi:protein-L-histidine N-pros-methyltransferase [Drosophila grimshawi]|uniref:GH20191 n=1 Tax=Drosophila grimshawi TaxID=7222 RepID=B4J644_DROGR|nr:protein-L-histidine N-pros-methyltransferase [Drosophila grimshawi]EDW01902.1 GH20191 [Drosophila grimshawi]